MDSPKIAFVGFGEINTPRGVIERLCAEAAGALKEVSEDVFVTAPVDDAEGYAHADRAVAELKKAGDFDLLVVCVAGWIPTHAIIRVIDHFRHKPMLLWALCGRRENGKLISTAPMAGASALQFAMRALKYRFRFVYNCVDEPWPMEKIRAWAAACGAARKMRGARLGSMGYRDMLLYGTMVDGVSLRDVFGIELEPFEMLEIRAAADDADAGEVKKWVKTARDEFVFTEEVSDEVIAESVRWALAIAERIRGHGYDAVSLIDVDGMKKLLGLPPTFIFNLVDLMCPVSLIPENDLMGSVTQLMVRYTTGQVGAYAEYYEFFKDSALVGVPDFIPREVTKGDAVIRPTVFGLLTTALLNVSRYKDGRVTLARLLQYDGKYMMHLFCGEAIQSEPWEEVGWEPPAPHPSSLEIFPDCGMDDLAAKVGSQHVILCYGDHRESIGALCELLGVEVI